MKGVYILLRYADTVRKKNSTGLSRSLGHLSSKHNYMLEITSGHIIWTTGKVSKPVGVGKLVNGSQIKVVPSWHW